MDLDREGTNVIRNSALGRNLVCNLYLEKAAVGTMPWEYCSWACLAQPVLEVKEGGNTGDMVSSTVNVR